MNKTHLLIKRFDEVFDLQMGKTPDRKNLCYFEGNNIWVSIRDMLNKEIWDSKEHISDEAITQSGIKKVKAGTVIMSFKLTVGKCAIAQKDLYTNEAIMAFNVRDGYEISPSFLYYYLQSYKWQGTNKAVMGITLNKATISKQIIAIPPLPTQRAIVAELDTLNEILDKKRQQLKELDTLAQSIFYDMFGDPVENEKGWEVSVLKDVSSLLNGRAYKQNELLDEGKYRVIRVGNFFTNGDYYYSDLELEEDKYCDKGDLLFAWSASFGAFIWSGERVIYHYHIWKVLFDEQKLDKRYYQYLLNTMTNSFMKDVHGIGMVHLTKIGMEQYLIPLPPLPLQQSFARKVEAIEKQKELINTSIKEVETLLNATMDKYFG